MQVNPANEISTEKALLSLVIGNEEFILNNLSCPRILVIIVTRPDDKQKRTQNNIHNKQALTQLGYFSSTYRLASRITAI